MKSLPEKIELVLIAKDFENTRFEDTCNCAISKAFKRQMEYEGEVSEGVFRFVVKDVMEYKHIFYSGLPDEEFDRDSELAACHNYSQAPIRTIILTKS